MATIYKRLLDPNKRDEQLLIFIIRNGTSVRLDYSSGIKLQRKYWNSEKLVKKTHPEHIKLNNLLQYYEGQIQVIVNQIAISESAVSCSIIKAKLDSIFNRVGHESEFNSSRKMSFFSFADNFIRYSTTTKKWGTVKTYKQTLNRLKKFNSKLDFEDFDMEFYSAFVQYLRSDGVILDSTIGKHIKCLKAILNEASEQGHNSKFDYKSKRFKSFRTEADTIHLSRSEISLIENLNLSKRPGLDRVRDLFLIGCNTGLRFSDLEHLTKDNIVTRDEGQYILIRTQKTEKQVMIPINATVKTIIQKYEGDIPRAISNQKMNVALKEIGELAGINTTVQITKKRAGMLEKHSHKKYQLITTHTARRSFATNAYLSGVPALAIMKITGHKSESSFMKYIKGSQEENAHTLAQHPFFK